MDKNVIDLHEKLSVLQRKIEIAEFERSRLNALALRKSFKKLNDDKRQRFARRIERSDVRLNVLRSEFEKITSSMCST